MPAFRWWEKDRNAPIVTNHPKDAVEIERRHSDGKGLLHADGASRANILSGDATHSMLTMSTVLTRRRPIGRDYSAYFARPYATFKTLNAVVAEYFRERYAAIMQKRRDEKPRIDRDRKYGLVRAWATVIQLDLQIAAVVGDLLAGRPVVYTTFLAYDEVAHHSGIEREDTLAVLTKVDRQLGRVEKALAEAPRPYRLVVLSDHGQSQGATFLQRYGYSLQDLVEKACHPDSSYGASEGSAEASAYINASFAELDRDQTPITRALHSTAEKLDVVGPDAEGEGAGKTTVAAGGERGRPARARGHGLGLPRADQLPPRARSPDPGADRGPLPRPDRGAPQPRGHRLPARRLREGRGARDRRLRRQPARDAARSSARTRWPRSARTPPATSSAPTPSPTAPTSSSTARSGAIRPRWPPSRSSSAHTAGSAGPQSFPFVLAPSDLEWPEGEVVGSETVHRIFRGWLAGLGQDAYADGEPGIQVDRGAGLEQLRPDPGRELRDLIDEPLGPLAPGPDRLASPSARRCPSGSGSPPAARSARSPRSPRRGPCARPATAAPIPRPAASPRRPP